MSTRRPRGPMLRNRIIGHGTEKPDQLLANPGNWRTHPDLQYDQLSAVMEQVGWVQDVIVNQRTGHMLDGHLRVRIALARDEAEVPVKYVDLSLAEERLVLATFDPLAALATRDAEKLAALVEETRPDVDGTDIDFAAIHGAPRQRTKGLTHVVNRCQCCEKRCRPGCGCYREEG